MEVIVKVIVQFSFALSKFILYIQTYSNLYKEKWDYIFFMGYGKVGITQDGVKCQCDFQWQMAEVNDIFMDSNHCILKHFFKEQLSNIWFWYKLWIFFECYVMIFDTILCLWLQLLWR